MQDGRLPEVGRNRRGASAPRRALVTLRSGDYVGLDGHPVDVQIDISRQGTPGFAVVGLPGKSTRESRDRIRAAIRNSGYRFPPSRILVNLAPASRQKCGAGFDLPVALGILLASGQVPRPEPGGWGPRLRQTVFLGELGLRGELRRVSGTLLVVDELRRRGACRAIVPGSNGAELASLGGLEVCAARSLAEAVAALRGERLEPPAAPPVSRGEGDGPVADDFCDVRGQEATKRALLVAAAGNHNVLLVGPPGVGKTMLARRLCEILPPLSPPEAMEVLRVRSALGLEIESGLPRRRPFRAPHHTISWAGMVGGGAVPHPGEVSRAHCGVLFLDELPEFSRRVLETLREPLEAGRLTVGRVGGSITFPARFLLVAAMNPCPCGYLGHPRRACRCSPRVVDSYVQRISGPLTDRIDIFPRVAAIDPSRILARAGPEPGLDSRTMAGLVRRARRRQARRWGAGVVNATVEARRLLETGGVTPAVFDLLRAFSRRTGLSARGIVRAVRVSRTVADLEDREEVGEEQALEALDYRHETASRRR